MCYNKDYYPDEGLTGYFPVPVGQAGDSLFMYSLLRHCLENGCQFAGVTPLDGFDRSADFLNDDSGQQKKILVFGIPTGMTNQLREDAFQSADIDTCRKIELCKTIIISVYKYDLESYDVVYPEPKKFIFDLGMYFPEVLPEDIL